MNGISVYESTLREAADIAANRPVPPMPRPSVAAATAAKFTQAERDARWFAWHHTRDLRLRIAKGRERVGGGTLVFQKRNGEKHIIRGGFYTGENGSDASVRRYLERNRICFEGL